MEDYLIAVEFDNYSDQFIFKSNDNGQIHLDVSM